MSELSNGKRILNIPPIFCEYWIGLVPKARELGYCLLLHGSMQRDLDIVAIPWVAEALSAEELVYELCVLLGFKQDNPEEGWKPGKTINGADRVTLKPHGRRAWLIWLGDKYWLDLSVLPRHCDYINSIEDCTCGAGNTAECTCPMIGRHA